MRGPSLQQESSWRWQQQPSPLHRAPSSKDAGGNGGGGESGEKAAFVSVLIGSIASLSKGFSKDDVGGESREAFSQALQATVQSLHLLGNEEAVRSRSMVLIHRMVLLLGEEVMLSEGSELPNADIYIYIYNTLTPPTRRFAPRQTLFAIRDSRCSSSQVLPFVGSFLGPLVSNCEKDAMEVVQLMNQLLIRFGGAVGGSMEEIILPFVRHCHDLVPVDGSQSQIAVEAVSLYKIQILFLQHVVSNECGAVFFSPKVGAGLEGILDLMCRGMEIKEGSRSCVLFLCKLCSNVSTWSPSPASQIAFWEFIFNRALVGLWRVMMGKEFNVKDAQCMRTLGEAAVLMAVVREKRGERFAGFIDALSGFVGEIKGEVVRRMKVCKHTEFKGLVKKALT